MRRKSRRERMIAVRKAARRHRRQSDEAEVERQREEEERLAELGLGENETVCPDCAEVIKRAARFCKHCGRELSGRRVSSERRFAVPVRLVNPVLAAFLSFVLPGLGQMYAGQNGRGVLFLFAAIGSAVGASVAAGRDAGTVVPCVWVVVGVAAIVDAYSCAQEANLR